MSEKRILEVFLNDLPEGDRSVIVEYQSQVLDTEFLMALTGFVEWFAERHRVTFAQVLKAIADIHREVKEAAHE